MGKIVENLDKSLKQNITPADIGAATSSHGTHVTYSTTSPKVAGTAAVGSANNVSRGDHVHPAQTSVSGNAGTATKLANARTLTIGNTGKTFDGSANVSWSLAEIGAAASSHNHAKIMAESGSSWTTATKDVQTDCEFQFASHISKSATGLYSVSNNANAIISFNRHSGPYASQLGFSSNGKIYYRWGNGTAITDSTAWEQIYTSVNKPTYSDVGAAAASHGTHVTYSTTTPKANGTAAIGSETTVARGDHVHPLQTSVSGNAGTATKLATARTLTIGNTGKSFNGSANVGWSLSEIGALPLTGGTLTGQLVVQTAADGTSGLVVQRAANTDERATMYIEDAIFNVKYLNDESSSSIKFTLQNTDDESNAGAGANTATATISGASGKSTIAANYFTEDGTSLANKYAAKSHGTHVTWSTTVPKVAGTAAVGTETNVARGDHVHAAQTSVSGNAGTATKLATARNITIGNKTNSFNGTANISFTLADIGAKAAEPTTFGLQTNYIAVRTTGRTAAQYYEFWDSGDAGWAGIKAGAIYDNNNRVYSAGNKPTLSDLGAAAASHGTHVTWSTTAPKVAGTAAVGSESSVARGDHVHAAQTSVSGNAGTATKLATARTITIGNKANTFDGTGNITYSLSDIGALSRQYKTAATAATAGWYRIATSAAGINRNMAMFEIDATVSGKHSETILAAGICYNQAPTLNQLAHTEHSNTGISKARIVYHTTYSGNYAYLEVYVPTATATTLNVKMIEGFGWSLVAPSTAGSIPSGYTNKEITFAKNKIVADFKGTGEFSSLSMSGTIALNNNVGITTKTASDITDTADATVAAGTAIKILEYNGSDNLHLGRDIYEKKLTSGNTYISGGGGMTIRTNAGSIALKPSDTSVMSLSNSQVDITKLTYTKAGIKSGGSIVSDTALTDNIGSAAIPWKNMYNRYYNLYGEASKSYGNFFVNTVGTSDTTGEARLTLGNSTATGTASNAYGRLLLYGTNTGYTIVTPGNNSTSNITVTLPSSGGTLARTADNVASATKLATARTLTIGSTGKTFDGSANVSWSLSEIGAAAASHNHDKIVAASGSAWTTAVQNPSAGNILFHYNVSKSATGMFPNTNNANLIISLNKHSGNYSSQLGFNNEGNIYYRGENNVAISDSMKWKEIAFNGRDSSLVDAITVGRSGSGTLTADTYASTGKCYNFTSTSTATTIYKCTFAPLHFGSYGLCVRLKAGANTSTSNIIQIIVRRGSTALKTVSIKGTQFTSTSQYQNFYTNIDYVGDANTKADLSVEIKSTTVSGVALSFDYARIEMMNTGVFL